MRWEYHMLHLLGWRDMLGWRDRPLYALQVPKCTARASARACAFLLSARLVTRTPHVGRTIRVARTYVRTTLSLNRTPCARDRRARRSARVAHARAGAELTPATGHAGRAAAAAGAAAARHAAAAAGERAAGAAARRVRGACASERARGADDTYFRGQAGRLARGSGAREGRRRPQRRRRQERRPHIDYGGLREAGLRDAHLHRGGYGRAEAGTQGPFGALHRRRRATEAVPRARQRAAGLVAAVGAAGGEGERLQRLLMQRARDVEGTGSWLEGWWEEEVPRLPLHLRHLYGPAAV